MKFRQRGHEAEDPVDFFQRRAQYHSFIFSDAVMVIMLDRRFVSRCSRLIFERRSLASTLSFSAYCSNVTNLSRHRSDSVMRKFRRRDRRPILVSRSSRASTKAVACLRIDSWMCCSAGVSFGGGRTVPKELMRFRSDGFFSY